MMTRLSSFVLLAGSLVVLFGCPPKGMDATPMTFVATLYCIVPGRGLVPSESISDPFMFVFTDNGDGTVQFVDGLCMHRPSAPEACS